LRKHLEDRHEYDELTFHISSGKNNITENPIDHPIAVKILAMRGVRLGSAYFHTKKRVTANSIIPSIRVSHTVIDILIF
jgi:hypothetical protein